MTNGNRIHIADWELEREQPYAYWLMCAPIGDATKAGCFCGLGVPAVFLKLRKRHCWIALYLLVKGKMDCLYKGKKRGKCQERV